MNSKYLGSNFDDFLREEGILEECQAVAIKRILAYHLQNFMEENQLSKTKVAKDMKTSRSALDRLLDPSNTSITLETMLKIARITGKKISVAIN